MRIVLYYAQEDRKERARPLLMEWYFQKQIWQERTNIKAQKVPELSIAS